MKTEQRRKGTLGTLPAGVYRLMVAGDDVRPLTEIVSVAPSSLEG